MGDKKQSLQTVYKVNMMRPLGIVIVSLTLLNGISGEGAPGVEGFPSPSFLSEWIRVSNKNYSTSLTEIPHGLGEVPILVKVLAKVLEGDSAGFVFEGTSAAQSDDDNGGRGGGVVYAYSRDKVSIWLPTGNNKEDNSYSVYVGGTWGSGRHPVSAEEIELQVLAWAPKHFYSPDFVSDTMQIDVGGYTYISLNALENPVLVKVTASFNYSGDVMYFEGTGSQQSGLSGTYDNGGGILFAYNSSGVRIWASPEDLFCTHDGWGNERKSIRIDRAEITVRAWKAFSCLLPSMNLEINTSLPSFGTFLEFEYPYCPAVRHVRVTLVSAEEPNVGFLFDATGMAQLPGNTRKAGGAVVGYNESHIRTWFVDKSMAPNSGTIVVKGWGGGHYQQVSTATKVIYQIWCGNNTVIPRCSRNIGNSCNKCLTPLTDGMPLVQLELIYIRSFAGCVHQCLSNPLCSAVGVGDDTCYLFADLQFGTLAYNTSSLRLYRISDA